jgi:membrane associated rhomboid family serine protease
MLPLRDDRPLGTLPIVTLILIAVNALAFAYQVSLEIGAAARGSAAGAELILEFGLIPCRLIGTCAGPAEFPSPALTVFTSMFVHGGLLHIGGNMLYLWIFGRTVEDSLGHGAFAALYLACGVLAALVQSAAHPESSVPMIGASGAVAGVLGAYALLFPHATILTVLLVGFFVRLVHVPALIVLGFWFVVQFFNGLLESASAGTGGVAWAAHVGGFLGGMVLLFLLRSRPRARL